MRSRLASTLLLLGTTLLAGSTASAEKPFFTMTKGGYTQTAVANPGGGVTIHQSWASPKGQRTITSVYRGESMHSVETTNGRVSNQWHHYQTTQTRPASGGYASVRAYDTRTYFGKTSKGVQTSFLRTGR